MEKIIKVKFIENQCQKKQSMLDTGCAKSLLISYVIHRRRRFAFEVNGEYGSVWG